MTDKEFDLYIDKINVRGIVPGLTSIQGLLERMGRPDKKLKYVHIAGTNGKGSLSSYTANILKAAGYKTGLYTSPCICDYREKIQVNNKMITKKALYEGMEYIKGITDAIESEGIPCPTLFEVETALAFWYFEKMNCDIVVLECGLGGEEDATNIIDAPLVAGFASISMDHMKILGDTVEKIASAKAGIIKAGSCVVTTNQRPEVYDVLEKRAGKEGCNIICAGQISKLKKKVDQQIFTYKNYKDLEISMGGAFQPENASEAIEIAERLIAKGFDIKEKHIREGLKCTWLPARFSVLSKKPLVISDGAHNEGAAIRLAESVDQYLKGRPLVYIMGMLADKECEKVVSLMVPKAVAVVTLTPPENPRALEATELAKMALKYCSNVTTADSVEEALEIAKVLAGNTCDIVAFGSLSYQGRLLKAARKNGNLDK